MGRQGPEQPMSSQMGRPDNPCVRAPTAAAAALLDQQLWCWAATSAVSTAICWRSSASARPARRRRSAAARRMNSHPGLAPGRPDRLRRAGLSARNGLCAPVAGQSAMLDRTLSAGNSWPRSEHRQTCLAQWDRVIVGPKRCREGLADAGRGAGVNQFFLEKIRK